jgi:hypothetical protein
MRKQGVREYEKSMGVGRPNPPIQESERYEIKDARGRYKRKKKKDGGINQPLHKAGSYNLNWVSFRKWRARDSISVRFSLRRRSGPNSSTAKLPRTEP